jgi:hypothetical protein
MQHKFNFVRSGEGNKNVSYYITAATQMAKYLMKIENANVPLAMFV